MQAENDDIVLVHGDDDLLFLDKPAGLLCVPGRGTLAFDALSLRVQARWPDALVVHRLDMATSGLVVMARGKAAQRQLSGAFAQRLVDKRYVAVVAGLVESEAGLIELPLAADWGHRPKQAVNPVRGKPSLTRYRVIARDAAARTTRVELTPLTGRTHQLRVHLLAIGYPVLGDGLYGAAECLPPNLRLMLHASALSFPHPCGGRQVDFESRPPF